MLSTMCDDVAHQSSTRTHTRTEI